MEDLAAEVRRLERWLKSSERREAELGRQINELHAAQPDHEFEVFEDTDGLKSIRMKTAKQIQTERDVLKAKLERVESVLKAWEEDWTCNSTIPSLLHDFQAALRDTDV